MFQIKTGLKQIKRLHSTTDQILISLSQKLGSDSSPMICIDGFSPIRLPEFSLLHSDTVTRKGHVRTTYKVDKQMRKAINEAVKEFGNCAELKAHVRQIVILAKLNIDRGNYV